MTRPTAGLACIVGGHLFADILDASTGDLVGDWCLWCGTGVYDGERITVLGQPVGFTPRYQARIPDGFHRLPEDAPPATT